MLRHAAKRFSQLNPGLGVRLCSSDITWSTGERRHPGKLDCPKGNKGEYPQKLEDGGIQYFGFKYYPRHPDEVDQPYEPAPLHLVTRVRYMRNKPWWERDVMKKFGLDGNRNKCAIIKNNPENNAHLWTVKHLVKIVPLRVPKDFPEDADPRCCLIKEDGEFTYTPHIHVDESIFKEDEQIAKTKWPLKFIDTEMRKQWQHPWQIKLL